MTEDELSDLVFEYRKKYPTPIEEGIWYYSSENDYECVSCDKAIPTFTVYYLVVDHDSSGNAHRCESCAIAYITFNNEPCNIKDDNCNGDDDTQVCTCDIWKGCTCGAIIPWAQKAKSWIV
jgi:predicted cupin superfamily sugar epimerase